MPTLAERLVGLTRREQLGTHERGPCLVWQGTFDRRGYGRVWVDGEMRLAHRVSYELAFGKLEEGLVVGHRCHDEDPSCPLGLCRHRRCIEPSHLEAQTVAENAQASKAKILTCPAGHEYSEANTLMSRGARTCRLCANERKRKSRARARERR